MKINEERIKGLLEEVTKNNLPSSYKILTFNDNGNILVINNFKKDYASIQEIRLLNDILKDKGITGDNYENLKQRFGFLFNFTKNKLKSTKSFKKLLVKKITIIDSFGNTKVVKKIKRKN